MSGGEPRRPWAGVASLCAPLVGGATAALAVAVGQGWLYATVLEAILTAVAVWWGSCAVGLIAAGVALARREPRRVAALGLAANAAGIALPILWHLLS